MNKAKKMNKAWVVIDPWGCKTVVFARVRSEAINSEVFDDMPCAPFHGDIQIKREKKYDIYAEKGYVPKSVLARNGWPVLCGKCGLIIMPDDVKYAYIDGEEVYCADCGLEIQASEEALEK